MLDLVAAVPPLAGRSPTYTVRQLFDLQHGTRRGPWSALMNAAVAKLTLDDMVANPVQPRQDSIFFGQIVTVDGSAWKLVKGAGRQPFDEVHDDPKDKVRALKIEIECEKRDGSHYIVDTGRQPLLEIDKAWHRFTLPSLQKLGVPLSQLKGKWVQVKRADTEIGRAHV